jgi:hypothetical protein
VEPGRTELTSEFLGRCLDLGLDLALKGADFGQQIGAMTEKGCPKPMAYWFANLVPILAGRRFLAASGPLPKLDDHYVLVDHRGNERAVRFADCAICRSTEWRLDKLDPADVLTLGLGSCEVQALNATLARLRERGSDEGVESITIEAPRMEG